MKHVTYGELMTRVSRELAKDGAALRRRAGARGYQVMTRNIVVSDNEDLIALGQELRVLSASEFVSR